MKLYEFETPTGYKYYAVYLGKDGRKGDLIVQQTVEFVASSDNDAKTYQGKRFDRDRRIQRRLIGRSFKVFLDTKKVFVE